MPASLTWLDYDSKAHQRAQRIITLFSERETRDELGIGPIRDAISDTLFPGTSVIHTRLRYVLFIPWMYGSLEKDGVSSKRIASQAREAELDLIEWLLENCPDESGIIGKEAQRGLKTLPSAIYWAGLGSWGLRLHPGTQNHYHRDLDQTYDRRRHKARRRAAALEEGDDIGGLWDTDARTWHPGIPPPPDDFPAGADFQLRRSEARFLQERLSQAHPESLLAHLAKQPARVECDAPWEHPHIADFPEEPRQLLTHGHNFSQVHHGAALLYNLLLAEMRGDDDRINSLRDEAGQWGAELKANLDMLRGWSNDIDAFWIATANRGHDIGPITMKFFEDWLGLALAHREAIFDNRQARKLVRNREIEKKKGNSRFTNKRMLDQWSGRSGLRRLTYRWALVSTYIDDLAAGVSRR